MFSQAICCFHGLAPLEPHLGLFFGIEAEGS